MFLDEVRYMCVCLSFTYALPAPQTMVTQATYLQFLGYYIKSVARFSYTPGNINNFKDYMT